MDAVFDQYAQHMHKVFSVTKKKNLAEKQRTRETHRNRFKRNPIMNAFVVVVMTFQFFSIVFIARFEAFDENKHERVAFFTFHSKLKRIHLNWPDICDIRFEQFLFYWLFFSWAHFNFFPLFSKAVEVTFISIYFDRISNWIAIRKKVGEWILEVIYNGTIL